MADRQNDQLRTDHAAELERIRDEFERTRQDADRLHREQWAEMEHLLKALVERVQADQARLIGLIEERNHLRDDLQETRAEADHAKSDQVRMAQDVAGMLDELRALTDRHADHAIELERVRDQLDRARQDAGLWREEADRERARIANLQADAGRR
jgi:chromosome segregation ATPase